MGGILVVGELAPDGSLTKLSTEVATLARALGEATGLIPAAGADGPAAELAGFLPSVVLDGGVSVEGTASERAAVVAAGLDGVTHVLLPASPDGRDLAGALSALTGWGVLANATGLAQADGTLTVQQSVFGGKLITQSAFSGEHGIVTVRPNTATAAALDAPGAVTTRQTSVAPAIAEVRVVDHIEAEGAAVSIDDARIIVSGGRGVGSAEGFDLLQDLATTLGGAVGATRAAVDSGWIAYAQQIGQTGKIVKPQLYLAMGISGAIQHKVGMQTASTIVAVNRDPDAPLADFADVYVVGDLFEVGRALLEQLRARSG
ncbi:MAG: electron transfer flavoprotein subunit alpha/FixB family protein [Candidatus Limnocylindrales bacterium]